MTGFRIFIGVPVIPRQLGLGHSDVAGIEEPELTDAHSVGLASTLLGQLGVRHAARLTE